MVTTLVGLRSQSMTRDEEGHRTYNLSWLLRTSDYLDGPETVLQTVNLLFPVGSAYSLDNDYDPWAFCTPDLSISVHQDLQEGEPCQSWIVTNKFTTKPMSRCSDTQIDNPLLEPYNISGDFTHVSREMKTDRFGKPLLHVNFEQMIGPEVEEKISFPSVSISFNSAILPLSLITMLLNKLNDAPLWGFPKRCVRFVDAKWERVLYGSCFYYYKISYTFETNLETFDKLIPAVGTKTLVPRSFPFLPDSYAVQKDVLGENEGPVVLNVIGAKADPNQPAYIVDADGQNLNPGQGSLKGPLIQKRELAHESNLLLLGIPTSIN
jgi:hypothetical protein